MSLHYICHPYSDDPDLNSRVVRAICAGRSRGAELDVPIAPQIYLPQFISEEDDRQKAMLFCLAMMKMCDYVVVYNYDDVGITEGMKREIELAKVLNKPLVPALCKTREEQL